MTCALRDPQSSTCLWGSLGLCGNQEEARRSGQEAQAVEGTGIKVLPCTAFPQTRHVALALSAVGRGRGAGAQGTGTLRS